MSVYQDEILMPVLRHVSNEMGDGALYNARPVVSTQAIPLPDGASDIELKAKQVRRGSLFRFLRCVLAYPKDGLPVRQH